METVKSTINIPVHLRDELNRFVLLKAVPSFSKGINIAIETYLKELRRAEYDRMIAEAAEDKAFIKRTMDCHNEMTRYESVVTDEW